MFHLPQYSWQCYPVYVRIEANFKGAQTGSKEPLPRTAVEETTFDQRRAEPHHTGCESSCALLTILTLPLSTVLNPTSERNNRMAQSANSASWRPRPVRCRSQPCSIGTAELDWARECRWVQASCPVPSRLRSCCTTANRNW